MEHEKEKRMQKWRSVNKRRKKEQDDTDIEESKDRKKEDKEKKSSRRDRKMKGIYLCLSIFHTYNVQRAITSRHQLRTDDVLGLQW
jgi:hypothetical protein